MFSKVFTYIIFICLLCLELPTLSAQTVFRGKILDETTQAPIAGAKIGINDQGVGVVTTASGNFNYRKYHQTLSSSSILQITAPGYETIEINQWDIRELFNKSSKIVMSPKEQTDDDNKPTLQNIGVFWDVSISSARADREKEWGFLATYLKTVPNATVHFIAFNDKILIDKKIGDISSLHRMRDELFAITPAGTTDLSLLNIDSSLSAAFLITDGDGVLGEVQPLRNIPLYAVSSIPRADHRYLKTLAQFTSGSYINLSLSTYDQGLAQIAAGEASKSDILEVSQSLKGRVLNGTTPVQGASILIKGDLEEFKTDREGNFSIPATVGDVIQINHFGMYPKEMSVASLDPFTISLKTLDELLDEVTIRGKRNVPLKKRDGKKINFNDVENSNLSGISSNVLLASQIQVNTQTIQDALRGRFAGVEVVGFGPDAKVRIRGNNSVAPIWVIDGSIFQDLPSFLDPQNVESLSVIKSSLAASRYGSVAQGGAILITTKGFATQYRSNNLNKALIKDNNYAENLEFLNLEQLVPDYVKQLKEITDHNAKFEHYIALSQANQSNASFYIDMALYFQSIDHKKTAQIRSRLIEIAHKNAQVLRIVAYLHEADGDDKTALKLYERVARIIPRESQSYRDLAQAYSKTGAYDKALELYINMLSEQILGVNFEDIDVELSHELLNLTARYGHLLDLSRLPDDYKGIGFGLDVRMTLEYSNRQALFEFQFISPSNKFYKFNHSFLENRSRLEAEQKNGFQLEEFIIDDAEHGLWRVNLEYLGNDKNLLLPNYIKFVVYWNYGTSDQREDIVLLKLTQDFKKGQFYEFLL